MKLHALTVSMLGVVLAHSGHANEPAASNTAPSTNNSTATTVTVTRNVTPSRERYTRKRIIELRQQVREYQKSQSVADKMDLLLGRYPTRPSREVERRYLINRFEFLALKAERGRATRADVAELRELQQILLGR
jgi:hypothetical protein